MYALTQIYHAFQNGVNRVPRTTFHKRLRKLQIETKPCKLKQIHRLKWLKAVPSRTSKCSLISHKDVRKLSRACGIGAQVKKCKRIEQKGQIPVSHSGNILKEGVQLERMGGIQIQKEQKDTKADILTLPEGCESSNTRKKSNGVLSNSVLSNARTWLERTARKHNTTRGGAQPIAPTAACKQTQNAARKTNGDFNSQRGSVKFSFSEPRFSFQTSQKRTIQFDIHSTGFSGVEIFSKDRPFEGNMRGAENEVACFKQDTDRSMDLRVLKACSDTNAVCNDADTGAMPCETNNSQKPVKDYFGFNGQPKEDKSWQTFGDVPDPEGAAVFDGNNENESGSGDIRFVNGFQFAAAAQQRRSGCSTLDSDSEVESVLSDLEINSNLSALSDLSVSSESLDSAPSSDATIRDRAGSDSQSGPLSSSDCSSERAATCTCHARYAYHHDHHNACTDSDSGTITTCIYDRARRGRRNGSHVNCQRTKKQTDTHLNSLNICKGRQRGDCSSKSPQNTPNPKSIGSCNGSARNRERKAQRTHRPSAPVHKPEPNGEHHDFFADVGSRGSCAKSFVLKKRQKSWMIEPKDDEVTLQRENGDCIRPKLGEKRNAGANSIRMGDVLEVNGKVNVKKRKKKKKDRGGTLCSGASIDCDENGNYTKAKRARSSVNGARKRHKRASKKKRDRANHKLKSDMAGNHRKVTELKRKLEAISSELERLQRGSGKKAKGGGEKDLGRNRESLGLKGKSLAGKRKAKRTRFRGVIPESPTFKLADTFVLPPSLTVEGGDLRPACSLALPGGVLPPKHHPVWRWRLGEKPLPKPPRQKSAHVGLPRR
ncbi:uncharacterized protein [Diadema antillarum]|uniref:uncharacterized protein n=1 Tax=Diadema antillarum TaxID=105358 RepID=UPI003A8839EB